MSQVSSSQVGLFDQVGDRAFQSIEVAAKWSVDSQRVTQLGQSAAQEPVVGTGEEHRDLQAEAGDLVAVGVRDALDEPVQAEPS